jgi:CRP-like cAMP-binding protein
MDIISYIKSFPVRTFSRDEILVASGEANDTLLAIREGFVKVTALDDVGRQKLLWIAGRYDIVPVEQLFSKRAVHYFYSGFTDGSAYVMDKSSLLDHMDDHPHVMTEIAHGLSEHYDDLLMRVNAVEQSDIRAKLLHVVRNICLKFSSSDTAHLHEIGLNLTHQDLADMIGSTREAVSLEMAKIKSDGLIDYTRSTFIVNMKAIEADIEAPA